jgi:hypothetical protein
VGAQKTKVAQQFQLQALRNDIEKHLAGNVEESTMHQESFSTEMGVQSNFFGFFHKRFFQALSVKL